MKTDTPVAIHRLDYQPSAWLIDHVRLEFDLHPTATRVYSELTLRRNPDVPISTDDGPGQDLRLDGGDCELCSVSVDGETLEPSRQQLDERSLLLRQLPDQCRVGIVTRIDPQSNTALEGLYQSSGNYCTQCEAEGFRRITYYLDRPDVLSMFDVVITADVSECPVLLSNGNLMSQQTLEDGRHRVHWHDPHPKPCYLFALVGGRLECIEDHFTTASGREVLLQIHVQSHNLDRCDFAMQSLKAAMRWDEEVYGLEYDLDRFMIVAVDDFNMGAMENKGLNIFNSRYVLADPQSATDADYMGVEAVIAHEYFHNWTGNRITCRDWFQLSLKEGLTVFRDQCFSSDQRSATVKRIADVRLLRSRQFAEDSGPMAHAIRPDSYIEINNFYTLTVYEKGAEVIRMLHVMLGAERWRQAMQTYVQRHDGTATTCDAFVDAVQSATDLDLSTFRRWYEYAGTPEVQVEEHYDASRQRLELSLTQHCPDTPGQSDKPALHIPVLLGLLDEHGRELPLQPEPDSSQAASALSRDQARGLLHLTQKRQSFVFENLPRAPVVSLLRGFSAPVRVRHEQDDATLAFLMSHDTDAFNRWDAAQRLASRAILGRLDGCADSNRTLESLGMAWGQILQDAMLSPAVKAETLSLPSLDTLMSERETVDFARLAEAHAAVTVALAQQHVDSLQALVRDSRNHDWPLLDARAMGARALANTALSLIGWLSPEHWCELAEAQYDQAGNMSDRLAALHALCHGDGEADGGARARVLADFHRRAHDNRLIMDKWFSAQAMSRRKQVVDDVIALSRHADFDRSNPNRLRSLVAGFALANPTGFHAADGRGYRFLAAQVLEVDPRNPQLAAGLVSPLGRWKRMAGEAGELMQHQLKRILDNDSLSRDVYELVSKSLQ